MKVGILTLPPSYNYGGILQAWSLQKSLKNMGHEVAILRPASENPHRHKLNYSKAGTWLGCAKRAVKKYLLGQKELFIFELPLNTRLQHTLKFVESNLNVVDVEDWMRASDSLDCVVVGSDQIWRKLYNYRPISINFANFADKNKTKVISYAASFGLGHVEYNESENKEIETLLKRFDAISVREDSGVAICDKIYNVKARCVCDPTLLSNRKDYLELIRAPKLFPIKSKFIMTYILDNYNLTYNKIVELAHKNNLQIYEGNSRIEDSSASLNERIQRPVEDWLYGIANAELLLTDSFHGTVFALIFHCPFYVILNEKRGASRIHSLLEKFSLTDRIIKIGNIDIVDSKGGNFDSEINWNAVDEKREELRMAGMHYLQNNL